MDFRGILGMDFRGILGIDVRGILGMDFMGMGRSRVAVIHPDSARGEQVGHVLERHLVSGFGFRDLGLRFRVSGCRDYGLGSGVYGLEGLDFWGWG